jgi:hypothetical protein
MTTDATALAKIGEWTGICGDKPEVLVEELADLGFAVVRRLEWRNPDDAPLETPFLVKATIFADPGYTDEVTDIFLGERMRSGKWLVRHGSVRSPSHRVLGWSPIPRALRKDMAAA